MTSASPSGAGYESFTAPRRRLLGPGPSEVHPKVLAAMAQPTIGHLDPLFEFMMDELKELLRHVFRTHNEATFPVPGPGSAGMETCFANLVEPGDTVVVCRNGVFGERMLQMVRRYGGTPVVVDDEWGAPVSREKLETALAEHPEATIVAFVQAETSSGVLTDPEPLVALAKRHGCLTIVDAVAALGGVPVEVDRWGIDAVFAATQKCLSCPPGLAPVSFNERAVDRIKARTTACRSWLTDLTLLLDGWSSSRRTYHYTAPVNALYGLHEGLLLLYQEGLEQVWDRHRLNQEALVEGLLALGLSPLVDSALRLPQLTPVAIPEGTGDVTVRSRMLREWGIEIGGGLGKAAGKTWRIGLMGYASREDNVLACLRSFEAVLSEEGHAVASGCAEEAAGRVYDERCGSGE